MISDRAREILARRGITLKSDAVPAIPPPPKPSSTSSTTISPTTTPPATPAPAISVVSEPAPARQETASLPASQPARVTQKKDAKPKVVKPKKDQAKARAKPTTTPIARPSEARAETVPVLHGDIWFLDGEPFCQSCRADYEFRRRRGVWECPFCEDTLSEAEVEQARAQADGGMLGRVVIDQAFVEAMADDLDALGLNADVLKEATKGRRPTDEQIEIVKACRVMQPGDALRIIAYAGAGKTSTLRLIGASLGGSGVYLAFNKDIAKEAAAGFPENIKSKTINSLAFGAVGVGGRLATRQDASWVMSVVRNGWLDESATHGVKEFRQATLTGRTLARFFESDAAEPTAEMVAAVLDAAGFGEPRNPPTDKREARKQEIRRMQRAALEPMILRQARAAWEAIYGDDGDAWRAGGINLTHGAYVKILERSSALIASTFAPFRYLLLDEAQDVNAVQISIVRQAMAGGTMIVAVGDTFQAIYSWRGSVNSLEILPGRALHLSGSFRFGSEIAEFAARTLDSRPGGGLPVPLRGLGAPGRVVPVETISDRGVVICRTNAGVLRVAGPAALRGRKVCVMGGVQDLADEVSSAIALHDGRLGDVKADALKRFLTWQELVDEHAATQEPDLRRFIEYVEDGQVIKWIDAIRRQSASEDRADLVVTTCHKSKGKEWDVVTLYGDFCAGTRAWKRHAAACADGDPQAIRSAVEEWHLVYVGATRAKVELRLATELAVEFFGHGWR